MAWQWVQRVFDASRARGSARLLLAALAEQADVDGGCWPSVATLARRATLGERQVRRLLEHLERSGELRILAGGQGPRSPNAYVVIGGRDGAAIDAAAAKTLTRMGSKRMTPATALAPRRIAPTVLGKRRQRADAGMRHGAATTPNKGDTRGAKSMTPAACKDVGQDAKSLTPATAEPVLEPAAEPEKKPSVEENANANARVKNAAAVESECEDEALREFHERIAQAESALESAREALPAELRAEQAALLAECESAADAASRNSNGNALGQLLRARRAYVARATELEATPGFARVGELERALADARKELDRERKARRLEKARERDAHIERRLREAGSDDQFLARLIPQIQRAPHLFEKVLTEFDRQRERIGNAGGWLRARLRAEGVTV